MKTQQLLILLFISWVQLSASETVPISILPLQAPFDDFPKKEEINAYLHSSFQYSSNKWTYQVLAASHSNCLDVECHLGKILKYQPDVKLILIPEVLGHGSFFVLNLKLIELPTLRVSQDIDLFFDKYQYPDFQDYKLLFKKLANDHFESKSELEEYYRARPMKTMSLVTKILQWWPALLFLPIFLIYPSYGGKS